MRLRAGLVIGLALGGAHVGCGLSGLDRAYGTDGGTVPTLDGRAPGTDGGNIPADASPIGVGDGATPPGDASVDASGDQCTATEDCTNGMDDDCNGLIDCADPQCQSQGFACTPGAIPAGWTLIAFSASARPLCPAAYGAGGEQAVVSNVGGAAATCGCACSGTAATCQGTAIDIGYPNSCATGAATNNLAVNNGACTAQDLTVTATYSYELNFQSSVSEQVGQCSGAGQVSGSLPAATFDAGATCAVSTGIGSGCSQGVCAPSTGMAFQQCIVHPGNIACPTFGFSQQLLASTGSPGYVDMRGCGGCTCGTTLSCGSVENIALFTSGTTCEGSAAFNVNSGCQLINTSGAVKSYKVSFGPTTGSAACTPTGAAPAATGSVVLDTNVETICCAP